MRRLALIFGLTLVGPLVAKAHDPYEIVSVVYIQTNRIEVFLEMEFATGMRLAGLEPSRQTSAESQFATALPQLEQFAGGLFEITAGNNVVLPLRTNVELGVELHIRGHLEIALTDFRPLRFVPRGLRAVPDTPYGVSLTVLDMVNKKVLGQAALFADSPPADFPATVTSPDSLAAPTLAVIGASTNKQPIVAMTTNIPAATVEATKPRKPTLLAAAVAFAAVGFLLVAWRWSQTRS